MEERTVICENTTELTTPVGVFSVWDGQEKVPFSVCRNLMCSPWDVYDEAYENVVGTIYTETNYTIAMKAEKLLAGKEYRISFSNGIWEYCGGDEHTSCYCTTIDGWMVGIGAYDPNDEEKDDQMVEYSQKNGYLAKGDYRDPPFYDESRFKGYTVWNLERLNGYKFK
ncbi:MAG: hypothetical protein IIV90_07840, partial [Oscillospiraceae bacterium]|nr:hypothetical protein [Oscillospiraceae bacterium]